MSDGHAQAGAASESSPKNNRCLSVILAKLEFVWYCEIAIETFSPHAAGETGGGFTVKLSA